MLFEEWDDEKWKVLVKKGFKGNKSYHLKGPSTTFVFNEHDFLQLYRNISSIAENIHEKEPYFIHDGTIINREIGTQLLGVVDDCEELNRLYKENKELKSEKIELLEENITYKNAYLAMKDLERENEQLKSQINDTGVAVEIATEECMKNVFDLIDDKILECEQAVEDIRYNGKDSYIVKHDVASRMLKELRKGLEQ